MEDIRKYVWTSGKEKEVEEWKKTIDVPTCELDKIGRKYNSDKCNVSLMSRLPPANGNVPPDWPNDLHLPVATHNYVEIYNELFEHLKDKPIRILEIGMGVKPWNGHSMRIWLEFFPNAEIHIIDNDSRNFDCDFEFDKKRVNFYVLDQGNSKDLQDFVNLLSSNYFDIIIDDGSHVADHQILTLSMLFDSLLMNEGIYCIEDIHDRKFLSYLPGLFTSVNSGNATFPEENEIKEISFARFYRSLIVLHKGKKKTR